MPTYRGKFVTTAKMREIDRRLALRALRKLGPDASREIKQATRRMSLAMLKDIKVGRARAGRQAMIVPVGRFGGVSPGVWAGGTKLVGRNRKPAYKVVFGSEFGANVLNQYKPWRGNEGYWFFKSVDTRMLNREHDRAVDAVIREFARGG